MSYQPIILDAEYAKLPEQFREGVQLYIEHGIQPGSFLRAVICNDLREAVNRADAHALEVLPELVRFFYWEAPAKCHGSHYKMTMWTICRQHEVEVAP